MATTRICSISDCDKPHWGHGYCRLHCGRYQRHGDPLFVMHTKDPLPDICIVDACDRPPEAKGLCWEHYRRQRLYGHPLGGSRFKPRGNCSVSGCARPAKAKGLCRAHYHRLLRHGDPCGGVPTMHGDPVRWLHAHADYDAEGCLVWPFWKNPAGYGGTWFEGQEMSAARAMCIIVNGPPPSPDHEVCHSCGKGHEACVHPKHVRWGTRPENMQDKLKHGTAPRGENCGTSKLSIAQVRSIRKLLGVVPQTEIADRFGVSNTAIWAIKVGRTWFWLED